MCRGVFIQYLGLKEVFKITISSYRSVKHTFHFTKCSKYSHDRKYHSTKNIHPSVSKRFGQEAFQLDGLSRKKTFWWYEEWGSSMRM
ncbi:hypothetical protein V1478_003407 [Vespula squamosa]|uniref:Uncharacterized protein n=1 Tax=Vespula squamosa TaxID=30214 RepID=A0ABD2BM97_VESSQ